MTVNLNQPWVDDIRNPIAGDSFGWYALEPTAAKKSLVIHHSGVNTNRAIEDGYSIASYHVNHNGWGGIGYHFVVRHDSHPKGAGVEYVGDLGTWRAHVANDNPGRVGICLVGNFEEQVPGPNQLRLARQLIEFLMAPNNILPSINYFSQVTGHGLITGQQTGCPGHQGAHFADWFNFLKGGNFPDSLYSQPTPAPAPEPAPTPSEPVPVPVTVIEGGKGGSPSPAPEEWLPDAWKPLREDKYVVVPTQAWDVPTGTAIRDIQPGTLVKIAGYFKAGGVEYARTLWAYESEVWNGIPIEAFSLPTPVPTPVPDIQPGDFLHSYENLSEAQKLTFWDHLRELLAILASPIINLFANKEPK